MSCKPMFLGSIVFLMSICLQSLASTPPLKGDAKAGQSKAISCFACHGEKGISPGPLWPNLNGQKQDYMLKQINDFKSGARKDPLMAPQVAMLSAKDLEDITAYFSSLK